jgi:hypothetical protein
MASVISQDARRQHWLRSPLPATGDSPKLLLAAPDLLLLVKNDATFSPLGFF